MDKIEFKNIFNKINKQIEELFKEYILDFYSSFYNFISIKIARIKKKNFICVFKIWIYSSLKNKFASGDSIDLDSKTIFKIRSQCSASSILCVGGGDSSTPRRPSPLDLNRVFYKIIKTITSRESHSSYLLSSLLDLSRFLT